MLGVTIVVLVESLSRFLVVIGYFLGDIEKKMGDLVGKTSID
jgi:hypothetical protein